MNQLLCVAASWRRVGGGRRAHVSLRAAGQANRSALEPQHCRPGSIQLQQAVMLSCAWPIAACLLLGEAVPQPTVEAQAEARGISSAVAHLKSLASMASYDRLQLLLQITAVTQEGDQKAAAAGGCGSCADAVPAAGSGTDSGRLLDRQRMRMHNSYIPSQPWQMFVASACCMRGSACYCLRMRGRLAENGARRRRRRRGRRSLPPCAPEPAGSKTAPPPT